MPLFLLISVYLLVGCASPQKEVEETPVESKIDRQAIRQTIQSHKRYISHCYGQVLTEKGQEHIKGTLMVGFNIGQDGKAQSTQIRRERSTIKSPKLEKCIISGLTTWDFPVHPKGTDVSVNYPFVFRAQTPPNMQKKLDQFQKLKKSQ